MDSLISLSEFDVIESLCRCCLAEDVELIPLFVTNDILKEYLPFQIISQFCDVIICPNDNLPSQICLECLQKVNTMNTFKLQVLDSQRILNEHFNKSGSSTSANVIKSLTDLLTQKFYNCATCDKKFTTEFNLIRHKRKCATTESKLNETSIENNVMDDNINLALNSLIDVDQIDSMLVVDSTFPTNKNISNRKKNERQLLVENLRNPSTLQNERPKRKCKKKKKYVDALSKYKKFLKKGIYICDHCDFDFKERVLLKEHINLVSSSDSNKYLCLFCNTMFDDKTSLMGHVKKSHNSSKPYHCNDCVRKFRKLTILQNHIRMQHTKEKTICCTKCPKKFLLKRDLNRHLKSHDSPFICNICDKRFKYKFSLVVHKKSHGNNTPQACDECGKVFSNLNRHKRDVHTGQSHQCPDCNRIFSNKSRLKRHQLSHTKNDERQLKCTYCDKRFIHKHNLKNHEMTHTQIKQYLCSLCGKGFIQHINLKNHVEKHHGNNNEQNTCSHCSKSFIYLKQLREHMKQHIADFKASEKSEESNLKPKLKLNEKTVDINSDRFICTICEKKFSKLALLKKHNLTHVKIPSKNNQSDTVNEKFAKNVTKKPKNVKLNSVNDISKLTSNLNNDISDVNEVLSDINQVINNVSQVTNDVNQITNNVNHNIINQETGDVNQGAIDVNEVISFQSESISTESRDDVDKLDSIYSLF